MIYAIPFLETKQLLDSNKEIIFTYDVLINMLINNKPIPFTEDDFNYL